MYDQFGSPQWFFDRCQEGAFFLLPFIIGMSFLIGVGIAVFVYKEIFKNKNSFSSLGTSLFSGLLTAGLSFFPVWYATLVFGYVVIGCSAAGVWPALTAAHPIHAVIKNRIQNNESVPQSLEELKSLMPKEYDQMVKNAKIEYVYNPQNQRYTLFVRPSKYVVAVFDRQLDYKMYEIPHFLIHSFLRNPEQYPPKTEGPWEKLPK